MAETIDEPYRESRCCYHWGLSHWISGIGEYFSRCICCNDSYDIERVYLRKSADDSRIIATSDCCCVDSDGTCDNPICGILCCPLVTICHLLTLPFVLCFCCREFHVCLGSCVVTTNEVSEDIYRCH